MANTNGLIGDAGIETVIRLACRRDGVTVPEVQDLFGVSYWSAYRYIRRLVRAEQVYQTERTRRRIEVHGIKGPGRPCKVYRARREAKRWADSLSWQARRRSRARSRSRTTRV